MFDLKFGVYNSYKGKSEPTPPPYNCLKLNEITSFDVLITISV